MDFIIVQLPEHIHRYLNRNNLYHQYLQQQVLYFYHPTSKMK